LDVLLHVPNSLDERYDTFDRDVEIIDYNKGVWKGLDKAGAPTVARPFSWLLKTRQEVMDFLAFLEVHKGKQIPFWVPSWSQDIELMQTISSSDVSILLKNINYTRMINLHPNRKDLIFFPAIIGGTPTIKRIIACSELVGTNEMMTLDSVFGVEKKVTDFSGISFLTLCRFDQDEFVITWHGNAAVISTTMREVLQ
jgi:hypothetical protein